jgi:hypothetical protein
VLANPKVDELQKAAPALNARRPHITDRMFTSMHVDVLQKAAWHSMPEDPRHGPTQKSKVSVLQIWGQPVLNVPETLGADLLEIKGVDVLQVSGQPTLNAQRFFVADTRLQPQTVDVL